MDVTIVVDVDLVDQAELEDVDRDLRIVDGLERFNDLVVELVDPAPVVCVSVSVASLMVVCSLSLIATVHFNMRCATCSASISASTSERLLYIANDARAVPGTSKCCMTGMAQ